MKRKIIQFVLVILGLFALIACLSNYSTAKGELHEKEEITFQKNTATTKKLKAPMGNEESNEDTTSNNTKISICMKKIANLDIPGSEYFNVPEEDLQGLELKGEISYAETIKRSFVLKYGEPIDLYKMFPELFSESSEGQTYTIAIDGNRLNYAGVCVNNDGNESFEAAFSWNLTFKPGMQYTADFYPVLYEVAEGASIVVNNINSDGDVYPATSERITDGNLYKQVIVIRNTETGESETIYQKYGEKIDFVKEYPKIFRKNSVCEIRINTGEINHEYKSVDINGNNILSSSNILHANEAYAYIQVKEDTNVNIDITSKVMVAKPITFEMEYDEEDPEGITHAPEYYDIRLVLGEGSFAKAVSYYKLINDDDGNLTYAWVDTAVINEDEDMPETPNGLVPSIRLNNNKKTEVIAPCALGVIWNINGIKDFQPGGNGGIFYSSSNTGKSGSGSWKLKYENEYNVKTFNKTDVEGNPVNASFIVSYDDFNHRESVSEDPTAERRKFIYNHYDSKVINGVTYANVYEVIGSTRMDDENSQAIINTQNGKYTLYYPLYYANYFDLYTYENLATKKRASTYELDKLHLYYGKTLEKIFITEIGTSKNFVINEEELEIDIAEPGNQYEITLIDTEKNKTIVNKKKPTITKKLDKDTEYDGEFTFDIFEKETNKLIKTIKVKANQEVAMEPLTRNESGSITGYLEDGKTYIIKELPVDNYEINKIEGKHGKVIDDGDSKYFEFTFDANLDKLQDVIFYNTYNKDEEQNEGKVEVNKEKIISTKTGDAIIVFISAGVIAIIGIAVVAIKKRHDEK